MLFFIRINCANQRIWKYTKNWNNKFHTNLREAISKGDYKYCSMMCPWVNEHSSLPEKEFKNKYIDPHTGKNSSLKDFNKIYKHQKLPSEVFLNFYYLYYIPH